MDGRIHIVEDEAMPPGHDFLLVAEEGEARIFYRRSTLGEKSLEDSWEAYRRLVGLEPRSPAPLRVVV